MVSIESLKNKKILVYGAGISGLATLAKLKQKVKQLSLWDDSLDCRQSAKKKFKVDLDQNFITGNYDFIVMSPGVDIYHHIYQSFFKKNFDKIITDIDIFTSSINLKKNKIILITGTNGKSTFCKLLYDVLKSQNKHTHLLGNFGKPVLSYKENSFNNFYILELSSYQIEYSKFLKSHISAILNITPDHLSRHKTFQNYVNIKLKIFDSLLPRGRGFVSEDFLFLEKIKKNNISKVKVIKNLTLKNYFLNKKNFLPSLSIIYQILKFFKISGKVIVKQFNYFKPLPHRQEFIRKIKHITFINDSKATNFDSANFSLQFYDNIFWIAGGLLKKNDTPNFSLSVRKKIKKVYLIGKQIKPFQKLLKKKFNIFISKNINNAIKESYRDAKKLNLTSSTILLSPAAASFDQFKNFEHRGNIFKNLVNKIKNV
jgi:UDP-N-acetylmuramoylalanine--D-glutamate ligase